jgi:transposase
MAGIGEDAAMLDLLHASRDDLIRLIVAHRDHIADLERRQAALEAELATQRATIARLTAQLGEALAALTPADDPPGDEGAATSRPMPGLKPAAPAPPPRPPRQRRAHGFARPRMVPTARVVHALAHCPDCGTALAGGTVKRTREVIEVPLVPAVVTEHVYLERRCPGCRRRCVPPPALAGGVDGQSRLGIGLTSLIAVLREEGRLPFATIQQLVRTVHGVELSVGAVVGAVQRVAARAGPLLTDIRTAIRASPVVGADETGWREDGTNGYAWTFSTPTQRLFVRGTREKAVLERELGPAYGGVLVSDCYVAYTHYEGRHQYCWAHLLRDIHDLLTAHPRDAGVRGWAAAVHEVFARAKAVTGDEATRRRAAQLLQADLAALCAPYLPPAENPAGEDTAGEPGADPPAPARPVDPPPRQRTLCQRIARHLADLFVFVEDPAVPATNNGSERSLRPLVVCRKISGGTRSEEGSTTKMTLASVFATWRAQGRNPFAECQRLLANPQP